VVDQAEPGSEAGYTKNELDEAFEKTLRPLVSYSARIIYVTLKESMEPNLTTLDMQNELRRQGVILSKKELNNWLSSLQATGLVQKEPERGKPTTIPYDGKYTYDLWSLTEKGRETARRLSIFTQKTPTLNNVKTIVKTGLPTLETMTTGHIRDLEKLYLSMKILSALRDQEEPTDTLSLSTETGIRHEKILEWIKADEDLSIKNLYLLDRKTPSLMDRMLASLGFRETEIYNISLSPEGKKRAEALA
jgi:DNA-binding HxlR family transcriptional regulator